MEEKKSELKTLSDKISDGALCEYGNVLLIEDVKQKMDDIKKEILKEINSIDNSFLISFYDGCKEEFKLTLNNNIRKKIDKHLGKDLK